MNCPRASRTAWPGFTPTLARRAWSAGARRTARCSSAQRRSRCRQRPPRGQRASRRAEEITRSFTFFLEEGYPHGGRASALPRLSLQAITGAIFEIIQRRVAGGEWEELPRHLPQLAYVALAPFMGTEEAIERIEA